jgi:hypothetical protein
VTRPRFELSKWYMDCVSPDGDALVVYSADLSWRRLRVGYEAAIEARAGHDPITSASLGRHDPPEGDGARITWHSPTLAIRGSWCRFGAPGHTPAPIHETIYDSADGVIEWSCLMPAADARLDTSSGPLQGIGYVEHLHMTVAPWRIPITSLRWGRIAARDEAIVWIEWLGDFQTTIVYSGGTRVTPVHVDDERIALADGTTITFDQRTELRRGSLGTTVLSSIPALRKLAPLRMLATEECKWLSRATVTRTGRAARETWAIHEVVTWPQSRPAPSRVAGPPAPEAPL